jgi:type II secretory pathway pseudopilin PulG
MPVQNGRCQRGFTLVEVTIILMVLTVLSAIMLPQMGNFNRLARFVKVREELGAICAGLETMLNDVGEAAFYTAGRGPHRRHGAVGLLVGAGDTPDTGRSGTAEWSRPVGSTFAIATDGGTVEPSFHVDTLANHLLFNTPLGEGERRWPTALDSERGAAARFQWRGPYLDEVGSDPWGNRYMVNVFALQSPPDGGPFDHYGSGVVCLSAGPDQAVSTPFNQPVGWRSDGDDMIALLNAGGSI